MIRRWLTHAMTVLERTPIFLLKRVQREHPDDGRTGHFFLIDSPDWVNVIALTPEDEIVFVRQYRHGTDSITLEIPGGCMDEGEDPLAAAKRELLEETGYTSECWEKLGEISANPAFMNNCCTTFLAHNARLTQAQEPDEHEELEVELHAKELLHTLIDQGEIHHGIVICAAYHLLRRESQIACLHSTGSASRLCL